ncbi:ester cyclase [Streptomyces milbemycinicus]|uniref:ester cyclase n=1 Tax=Streptomyces milbemycinicus TaxID=476552 RepID=UPI0033D96276
MPHICAIRYNLPRRSGVAAASTGGVRERVDIASFGPGGPRPPLAQLPHGPAGVLASGAWTRSDFSDLRFPVLATARDDDQVWVRLRMQGRHTGPFVRFREGALDQAIPLTGLRDDVAMLGQLGIFPSAPAIAVRMLAWRATGRAAGAAALLDPAPMRGVPASPLDGMVGWAGAGIVSRLRRKAAGGGEGRGGGGLVAVQRQGPSPGGWVAERCVVARSGGRRSGWGPPPAPSLKSACSASSTTSTTFSERGVGEPADRRS